MRRWVAVAVVLTGVLAGACQAGDDAPVESAAAVPVPTPSETATGAAFPERPAATAAPVSNATPSPTAVPAQPSAPTPTATPDAAPAYLLAVHGIIDAADSVTGRLLEIGFVPPSPTDEWSSSIEGMAIELANLVDDWQKVDSPPAFSEFHGLYLNLLNGWLRVAQVNAHWPRVGPDLEQQLAVSKEHQETYDTTLEAVAVAQAAYDLMHGE